VARAQRLVVDDNEVYANDWNGIWADTASQNVVFSNNRVHHNLKYGMHLEISDQAEIHNNAVWENGWGVTTGGAGITLVASRDVDVYGNTLAWNASGILVVNSQRDKQVGGSDPIFDTVSRVHVHHNTIVAKDYTSGERLALAWRKAWTGGNIYERSSDNRGYDNRYWYPASEGTSKYRFLWDGKKDKLGAFNDTSGEERGSYLSNAEKEQLLASESIPFAPER
jgi:parallel beta-helix repeat protein